MDVTSRMGNSPAAKEIKTIMNENMEECENERSYGQHICRRSNKQQRTGIG
ncbi:MAG: hypothetical protein HGA49_11000 [Eubacteriaceae bacterium]|nr:hypothetical protein [Eubacteriaceae bacterium]